jgi:hypothetical protein
VRGMGFIDLLQRSGSISDRFVGYSGYLLVAILATRVGNWAKLESREKLYESPRREAYASVATVRGLAYLWPRSGLLLVLPYADRY